MATDSSKESGRSSQFDADAVDDVAQALLHLGGRFEAVAKFAREKMPTETLTVDGGRGIYDLLNAAANLVNKLQAAVDKSMLPKPREDMAANGAEPEPTPAIDGTKKPKAKR